MNEGNTILKILSRCDSAKSGHPGISLSGNSEILLGKRVTLGTPGLSGRFVSVGQPPVCTRLCEKGISQGKLLDCAPAGCYQGLRI